MAIFNTLRANLCLCELFTGLLHISYNVIMAAASVAEGVAITFEKAVFMILCVSLFLLSILFVGNGDVKNTRTYEENDTLQGYVMDLQKFEKLLKQEVRLGNVEITEKEIITDKTFEL